MIKSVSTRLGLPQGQEVWRRDVLSCIGGLPFQSDVVVVNADVDDYSDVSVFGNEMRSGNLAVVTVADGDTVRAHIHLDCRRTVSNILLYALLF